MARYVWDALCLGNNCDLIIVNNSWRPVGKPHYGWKVINGWETIVWPGQGWETILWLGSHIWWFGNHIMAGKSYMMAGKRFYGWEVIHGGETMLCLGCQIWIKLGSHECLRIWINQKWDMKNPVRLLQGSALLQGIGQEEARKVGWSQAGELDLVGAPKHRRSRLWSDVKPWDFAQSSTPTRKQTLK